MLALASGMTSGSSIISLSTAFTTLPTLSTPSSNRRMCTLKTDASLSTINFLPLYRRQHSSSLYNSEFVISPDASSSSSSSSKSNKDDGIPLDLQLLLNNISSLKSGSDLRGSYATHEGSIPIANYIAATLHHRTAAAAMGGTTLFTPLVAYCFGVAFARWTHLHKRLTKGMEYNNTQPIQLCIGQDPRSHGISLADAFARGAESVSTSNNNKEGGDGVFNVVVSYTGIATTPSMYEFVRATKCDAAVMITASHLPPEKNGMKFFATNVGGLSSTDIDELIRLAQDEVRAWYKLGIVPPLSSSSLTTATSESGVKCTEYVNYMPYYADVLKCAIQREVDSTFSLSSSSTLSSKPLVGLKIVVNPGKGSGCFFTNVLHDLGADITGSIYTIPDGSFPITFGVPNPEKKAMVDETIHACMACNADIGILFDTDADRAGFVLPRVIDKQGNKSNYEPLNRNRLIALLGVIFAKTSPGCTIVTDSTTSEGLGIFLEEKLKLHHYRYLRGYANVIRKAKEITDSGLANAEVAIETSGHCAMKENGYVDDGTYTAVKIIGLLARTMSLGGESRPLLDLISDLIELPFDEEFRIKVTDGLLSTTSSIFEQITTSLIERCNVMDEWSLDVDNLEGVRIRLSSGGFFMIRQSLHDPVMSIQVESSSKEDATKMVLMPLLDLMSKYEILDCNALAEYDY
jgi:phosphomannomutase